MSDEQTRGRRRPSNEPQSAAKGNSGSSSGPRRTRDDASVEPPKKQVKTEQGGDLKPSTSRAAVSGDGKGDRSSSVASEGSSGATARGRQRNENYVIVHSRPADLVTKLGSSGKRVTLQTNYYRLQTKPKWRLFQYSVNFEPEVELRRFRCGLLSQLQNRIGGYIFDGSTLFTTIKLEGDCTEFKVKSKRGEDFTILVRFVTNISMADWQSLQVLNLILRRSMEGLNLQLVGRNFYDPQAKIDIRNFSLQLWPGYVTSIRQHEQNILLCAELTHKVMRTETVYDILMRCCETTNDYKDDFRKQVIGLVVLTDYNNKTYRVNDIDFSKSPTATFNQKDKEVRFIDYYQEKYNIRIKDTKQPLLISKVKDSAMNNRGNDFVILIPELCRPTGLTDSMRNNFQQMRAMADYTRMNPDRRMERLQVFNNRLQTTEKSVQVLNEWHMTLERNLVQLEGRELEPQRIIFDRSEGVSAGENADWTRHFRDNGMFTSPSRGLERWAVIGTNRNMRELRSFYESLMRAANGMKMNIGRPREVMIHDDRNNSYLQALDDCCRSDPQLILCLVPNNNVDRYTSIKKKACLERAVPTQVITYRSASNQRGLMSIATKVAIQINCKLGYTPWMIELPLSGLMTIGYDIAKCPQNRSKAFGALVASMDLKSNATFYSTVAECNANDKLSTNLWPMMAKALRQYYREHKKLPARILFYRDGVSDGMLKQIFEYEVKEIVEKLEQEYERVKAEKPPMFNYIVVSKSINTRLFKGNRNPGPGTVIDDVITLPERFDFYLVSQQVRQGSVSPTSYNILHNGMKLNADRLQLLTFKMCHLYYNWSGTTRVPAVCQYAKKLATLVATNLYQPPQNVLEKKLFYL